ncbi:Ger(x)C family spore germination protein [Halalkalibacter sp. APA_J-10(15)]|uniref:Ger(x)C family spore germination protein n=1 Tax=Halalkalibacter sp. APA_J-10(15) TaxID=2933805 RepID=UPI001FF199B1|nr:Ger(x)C family spore germination protein [Halalkalibacter sp. APA_J-10(15)]MCK0473567.1 Ger(x)C family spore germination protein [Halalkalibacter sp. APA_J-10(15)]
MILLMKALKVILILMCLLLLLSGCWDRFEIEDRANILGIAIDLVEDLEKEEFEGLLNPKATHLEEFPSDKDMIRVTTQIALPGGIPLGPIANGQLNSEDTVWVVEVLGKTIADAMHNLQQKLSQKLYLGHLQLVIMSEEIARKGLGEINDYLHRNHEVRRTAWLLVNGEDAGATLKAAPPVSQIPSLFLSQTLDNAVRLGKLPKQYIGHFWIASSRKGREGFLPYIKVVEGENILLEGVAYFKGDRMVGRTLPIEIGIFMAMRGENPSGYSFAIPLPEQYNETGIVRVEKRKSNITVVNSGGKLKAQLDVNIFGVLEEKTDTDRQMNASDIRKLEEEFSKEGKLVMTKLLEKLQEDGSDIIGVGEVVRGHHSKYWDNCIKTKENWQQMFSEMDIDVSLSTRIERAGKRAI